jgi:osmotically inducible protein OsmC
MTRTANSIWKGAGLDGVGELTTQSKALSAQPYSFKLRFENEDGKLGTNPEELIAAAHAGCFNMALSFVLKDAGFVADELNTEAKVILDKDEIGFYIKSITLNLKAKIAGIEKEKFIKLANSAKEGCPISRLVKAPVTLITELI